MKLALESIKAIRDAIRSENKRVDAAYQAALRNANLDQAALDAIEGSLEDDLTDAASMLEAQIQMALDRLSNDEFDRLRVDPVWIDEAAAAFKEALQRQLMDKREKRFSFAHEQRWSPPLSVANGC